MSPVLFCVGCCRRCLRPIILLLDSTPCPPLSGLVDASTGEEKVPGGAALAAADDEDAGDGDQEGGGSKAEERQLILSQALVGEVVLATKEVREGMWDKMCLQHLQQQKVPCMACMWDSQLACRAGRGLSSMKERLDSCWERSNRVSHSSTEDPIAATQLPHLAPPPLSCSCQPGHPPNPPVNPRRFLKLKGLWCCPAEKLRKGVMVLSS